MAIGMNRIELQTLADDRAKDALALIHAQQWSGAYYLAGYAIECALKACIANLTNQYDYPDKDFANKCYTHNIETLVNLSGLADQRKKDAYSNILLGENWSIVKDWDEKARYQRWTELKARKLVMAVTDSQNGVLSWIKVHW
jgi:hypothetical protein